MKGVRALSLVLALILFAPAALAADAPYYTFTQDYRGSLTSTQDGYLPEGIFSQLDGKTLKRALDLFIDENDVIYIADTGNKRVVSCTLEGEWIKTYGEDVLKEPEGVCVRGGLLYVADSKLNEVRIFDVKTGAQVSVLETPTTPLYGSNAKFRPRRIVVDAAGSMYVISAGNTNGIAQFAKSGEFLSYFGANDTALSFGEMFKRILYTQEQLDQLRRNVPVTATSLDMDARGLIYTVTSGAGANALKKFNMAGLNILPATDIYLDVAVDVAVGALENIFVLSENGYIIEYTREGSVLFFFGGQDSDRNRDGLFVVTSALDVDSMGNLYVLDKDKNIVQRFVMTEYAVLVHEALALYQDGHYAKSRAPWEQVLRMNSLFDYARMGLGKAYYKLEMYDEALSAFRLGGDKDGYSDAFWEVRNTFLQDNILYIGGALVLLALLKRLWKLLRDKTRMGARIHQGICWLRDRKLCQQLAYVRGMLKNPADGYYGIKHEGKVSVLSATVLYGLFFALYEINKYYSGFLFKTAVDGRFDFAGDIALVLGVIALFLVSCNLICSIQEGEGTFKQLYCSLAYALAPYLLFKPLVIVLSFVLTYNEAFILTLMNGLIVGGCLVMIVLMVREIQSYTYKKSFGVLLLTAVTMLLVVVAGAIALSLLMQLWEFLYGLWREAIFFYEA